jgi:hypothetical protein
MHNNKQANGSFKRIVKARFASVLTVTALVAASGFFAANALAQQPAAQQPAAQQPNGQQAAPAQTAPRTDEHAAEEKLAESEALGFLKALDEGRYKESYDYTSNLIRSKMDSAQLAAELQKDRQPVGKLKTRKLLNMSYTTTLPNAPAGEYVVLQYQTDFEKKSAAVETMTMVFENGYWRVAGWFMK